MRKEHWKVDDEKEPAMDAKKESQKDGRGAPKKREEKVSRGWVGWRLRMDSWIYKYEACQRPWQELI